MAKTSDIVLGLGVAGAAAAIVYFLTKPTNPSDNPIQQVLAPVENALTSAGAVVGDWLNNAGAAISNAADGLGNGVASVVANGAAAAIKAAGNYLGGLDGLGVFDNVNVGVAAASVVPDSAEATAAINEAIAGQAYYGSGIIPVTTAQLATYPVSSPASITQVAVTAIDSGNAAYAAQLIASNASSNAATGVTQVYNPAYDPTAGKTWSVSLQRWV